MSDIDKVMQAFTKAKAEGNMEAAKKYALMAKELDSGGSIDRTERLSQGSGSPWNVPIMPDVPAEEPRSGGAMPFANRAIAETIGAPVDLITMGVNALPGMDDTNKISDPFLGRKSIERGMESIGIQLPAEGQHPQTVPEHLGRVVGETAAFLNPATAVISKTAKGAGLVSKIGKNGFGNPIFKVADPNIANTTGKVASSVMNSMAKHPYITMVSEFSGSVGAGAGRGVAAKEFEDSPGIRSGIEILGGTVLGLVPMVMMNTATSIAIRSGKSVYGKLSTPLSKAGQTYRAGKYIKDISAFPEKAAVDVGEETISYMPPAVKTGEKKIVQLYKSLIAQDPLRDAEAIEKLTGSIIKLDKEMRKMGYGSPELLEEIMAKRITALELSMDQRVVLAAETAQKKLNAIPVAQRKASEARIVNEELRKVKASAYKEVEKKWLGLNKDFETGFEKTRQYYNGMFVGDKRLGKAELVDIPVELRKSPITNPKASAKKRKAAGFTARTSVGKQEPTTTTLREMQALRSKLRATAMNARAGTDGKPNWNKARIADDVSDAILEDLDDASRGGAFITREEATRLTGQASEDAADIVGKNGVGLAAIKLKPHKGYPNGRIFVGENHGIAQNAFDDAGYTITDWQKLVVDADGFVVDSSDTANLKEAIAATNHFKTRFESGEVGKILGYSRSGAPAINPDLTLEVSAGRLGERGAIEIEKIVITPEARAATQRYLGRSFTDFTDPNKTGAIDTTKAARWIKNNEALLDEYPNLRSKMADATQAQELADTTRARMDARKKALRDPKISTSARYLNVERLDKKVDDILRSRHPSKMAAELVRQARKDPTGEALGGLRAGFIDHILRKSAYGEYNDIGERTLSGGSMLGFIKENESTMRMVFDTNQIARMRKIGTEFAKLDKLAKLYPGKIKIEMKDWASNILNMAARLSGASIGGRTGGSMGGSLQHAQIVSGRARRFMMWLTKDKSEQFVSDAILSDDPKLLQSFLGVISKPKPKKQDIIFFNKQLNLWLASTGRRVADDIQEESGE